METENHNSSTLRMVQDLPPDGIDDRTTIAFATNAVTPMTIDESAPGEVIELSDDFDFVESSLPTPLNLRLPSTTIRSMSIPLA